MKIIKFGNLNAHKEKKCRKLLRKWSLLAAACLFLINGCSGKNEDLLLEDTMQLEDSWDGSSESLPKKDSTRTQTSDDDAMEEVQMYIYVCGCVQTPGVYVCEAGARIYEAVEAAGGFTEEAQQAALNLAEVLCDGQMVYVPSTSEQDGAWMENGPSGTAAGLVNINTATKEELMTLTGIGEAKAQSIVSYREKEGAFSSIEEIMNIEGIKDGVFNKIKDDITV